MSLASIIAAGGHHGIHRRINCGGGDTGIWKSDAGLYDQGNAGSVVTTWEQPLLPGQPPVETSTLDFFRSFSGTMTYTIPRLKPSTACAVRIFYGDSGFGFRMSINANGVEKVPDFVLQTAAGGAAKIGLKVFTANADVSGNLALAFVGNTLGAVSAIEVHQPATAGYKILHTSGDSITSGGTTGVTETDSWPYQLSQMYNGNYARFNQNSAPDFINYDERKLWTIHNIAVAGDTIGQQATAWSTYANSLIWTGLLAKNICLLDCGINNILGGAQTANQVETALTDYFTAVDPSFIKGATTLTPTTSADTARNVIMAAVNNWINANSITLGFVIDWNTNALLADPLSILYADGLHNNRAGYTVRAQMAKVVLDAL